MGMVIFNIRRGYKVSALDAVEEALPTDLLLGLEVLDLLASMAYHIRDCEFLYSMITYLFKCFCEYLGQIEQLPIPLTPRPINHNPIPRHPPKPRLLRIDHQHPIQPPAQHPHILPVFPRLLIQHTMINKQMTRRPRLRINQFEYWLGLRW